jgi:hypothetical protein
LYALQALNGIGSYCALVIFALMPWDAAVLMNRGWAPWAAGMLTGAGQGAAAVAAVMLGLNAVFAGATFFATLYASIAFDVNARAFLECVHRVRVCLLLALAALALAAVVCSCLLSLLRVLARLLTPERAQLSGGVGIGLPHAGRRAAASLTALRQLGAMRDMLEQRAAARAGGAAPLSLAVHLAALAERGPSRGLGIAALALAPEEAATLARLFARHDADGDDKLNADELRNLMSELVPSGQRVSDEAARAALSILDADGDSLVELDEFAAWYATARLWHHGEPQQLGGKEARETTLEEAAGGAQQPADRRREHEE